MLSTSTSLNGHSSDSDRRTSGGFGAACEFSKDYGGRKSKTLPSLKSAHRANQLAFSRRRKESSTKITVSANVRLAISSMQCPPDIVYPDRSVNSGDPNVNTVQIIINHLCFKVHFWTPL